MEVLTLKKEYRVLYRLLRRRMVTKVFPSHLKKLFYKKSNTKFTRFVVRMYAGGGIRK